MIGDEMCEQQLNILLKVATPLTPPFVERVVDLPRQLAQDGHPLMDCLGEAQLRGRTRRRRSDPTRPHVQPRRVRNESTSGAQEEAGAVPLACH